MGYYIGVPYDGSSLDLGNEVPKRLIVRGRANVNIDFYDYPMSLSDGNMYAIGYINDTNYEPSTTDDYCTDDNNYNGTSYWSNIANGSRYWIYSGQLSYPGPWFGSAANHFGDPNDYDRNGVGVHAFTDYNIKQQNTITFNKVSGSGGTSSTTANYGQTLPTITPPTRSSYTFLGYWYGSDPTSLSGQGQYYTENGTGLVTFSGNSDMTLYARWKNTVTYNPTSSSCYCIDANTPADYTNSDQSVTIALSNASCASGETVTITASNGWAVSNYGRTITVPSRTAKGSYNITLTASSTQSTNTSSGYSGETITRTITITVMDGRSTTYGSIYITDMEFESGYLTADPWISELDGEVVPTYFDTIYMVEPKVIPASAFTLTLSNVDDYINKTIWGVQEINYGDGTTQWLCIEGVWGITGGSITFPSLGTTQSYGSVINFDNKLTITFTGAGGATRTINVDDYISPAYDLTESDVIGGKPGAIYRSNNYIDNSDYAAYDYTASITIADGMVATGTTYSTVTASAGHKAFNHYLSGAVDSSYHTVSDGVSWTITSQTYTPVGGSATSTNRFYKDNNTRLRHTTMSSNYGTDYVLITATNGSNSSATGTADYTITNSQPTVTVTLNANGGSGGTGSVQIAQGTAAANYPSITLPTRSGYTFLGFYDTSATSGGTQYYNMNGAGATTFDKTSACTLYARWRNEITYNYNGSNERTVTSTYSTSQSSVTIATASSCASGENMTYPITDGNTEINWSFSSDGKTMYIPAGTNAGSYWVEITVQSPSGTNYTSDGELFYVYLTISPADSPMTITPETSTSNRRKIYNLHDSATGINTFTITPSNAQGTVTYSSSDTSKATVSSSGVVTYVANGDVTITVVDDCSSNSNYNSTTKYCYVQCKADSEGSTRYTNTACTITGTNVSTYGIPSVSIAVGGFTASGGGSVVTCSVTNNTQWYQKWESGYVKNHTGTSSGTARWRITSNGNNRFYYPAGAIDYTLNIGGTNYSVYDSSVANANILHYSMTNNITTDTVTVTAYNIGDSTKSASASASVTNEATLIVTVNDNPILYGDTTSIKTELSYTSGYTNTDVTNSTTFTTSPTGIVNIS